MIICATCGREMTCVRNGVSVDFGAGHCYAGDVFQCGGCGAEVCVCNTRPHYDADYKLHRSYLRTRDVVSQLQSVAEVRALWDTTYNIQLLNERISFLEGEGEV